MFESVVLKASSKKPFDPHEKSPNPLLEDANRINHIKDDSIVAPFPEETDAEKSLQQKNVVPINSSKGRLISISTFILCALVANYLIRTLLFKSTLTLSTQLDVPSTQPNNIQKFLDKLKNEPDFSI